MTNRPKVLIVDDVAGWCEQIAELLREGGFEAVAASDKQAALAELDRERFDAAVIDVNLSDSPYNVDGLLINQHIQRHALGTKVILISARSLSPHEQQSIRPATFVGKSTIIRRGESIVDAVRAALETDAGDDKT